MTQSAQSSRGAPQNSNNPIEPDWGSEDQQQPPEMTPASREQMLSVLNRIGLYQKRLLLLVFVPFIMCGYTTMSGTVALDSPKHRCRVPGLVNDTYSIQSEAHRTLVNLSIPTTSSDDDVSYSKCDVYKERDVINTTSDNDTEPCDRWVYDDSDFDRTIVTQFDLVCEDKGFRAKVNMMYMLGLLVGSSVSGILCDRFGRKKVMMVCMMLDIVVVIAMAFPGLPAMLLVYRFLAAAFNIGFYLALYVLCLEFMGTSDRTLAGTLMSAILPFGSLLNAGLSYVIRDWRWLQILNGAPFIILISYWWLIDESPRWLLTKGHVKEAGKVISKVMKVNKMTMPVDLTSNDDAMAMLAHQDPNTQTEQSSTCAREGARSDSIRDPFAKGDTPSNVEVSMMEDETDKKERAETQEEQNVSSESPLKLFKYPNLIARTAIIFFNWSAISMTYYGLSLNVANLDGSVRLNFIFSSLVELIGYLAPWPLLNTLGRKRTHCAAMLLSGISCLATILPVMLGSSELHWLTTLLMMLGKLGISAAFCTVYLMTGELFPTVIRNIGVGYSSAVARAATALSPYIADLSLYIDGKMGQALPLIIFGSLALAAGLMALCLPETLHRKLPDTILEAANFTKKKSSGTGQTISDDKVNR